MADIFEIAGRIHSTSQEGVAAVANEILDETKGKKQSQVNAETDATLAEHTSTINGLNSQNYVTVTATDQTTAVTDVLPATGEVATVYRVGNWDGSQYDETCYSEYSWNGSQYIHLDTKTQIGEVFDISAYHATGGTFATYADLSAALDSNNSGGVPQSLQKGGMSIKFIQSSDNKYVQFRYMGIDTTVADFTNVDNWQEIQFIAGQNEEIDLSDYQECEALPNMQGKWFVGNYYGKFIPVLKGEKIVISATSNVGSICGLVKTNMYSSGSDVSYAYNCSRVDIPANGTVTLKIPFNAKYLYVYTRNGVNDITIPVSVYKYTKGDIRHLYSHSWNREDLSVGDENGNDILELYDGHIFTKKFSSKDTPFVKQGDADFSLCDEDDNTILDVFNGHIFTKNFNTLKKSKDKLSQFVDDVFVIAASDSTDKSKKNADIVCDGTNDSLLIENCIKSIQGSCGTLVFCAGTYNMTFRAESANKNVAILIPRNNKQVNLTAQHDNGITRGQVIFKVSEETYNNCDINQQYTIIKHVTGYGLNSHLRMDRIFFEIYDNQKNITCIDAQYTGQIVMNECRGSVTMRPGWWGGHPQGLPVIPVIDCVFFKGSSGSLHAGSRIVKCSCTGFGIGWGVQGEHLYMNSCGAVNCLYGFYFNPYSPTAAGTNGMQVHPMILINCLEEGGLNFPHFGNNPQKQSVLIFNWHIEHRNEFFNQGGHYATEDVPGSWYGHIDYAIQYFPQPTSTGHEEHVPNIQFWADGHGHGMDSVNVVHKKIVTTTERLYYAPNYGQTVFDTDLNKTCICIDPDTKTWVDCNGNNVDNV